MKHVVLQSLVIIAAMTSIGDAQTRRIELTREERAARIEAVREARHQEIKAARVAARQAAKETGRQEARQSRSHDRQFHAVWARLAPDVRAMYAARELAERVSRKPAWTTQTRAERIASVTDFIANYPAIKAARQRATLDAALGTATGAYPDPPAVANLLRRSNDMPTDIEPFMQAGDPVKLAASVQPPPIATFPEAELPDLFTVNRAFNWNKPNGQWMNQMLKDIDKAKAAGDVETYQTLTRRYSAWADKYLRRDAPPDLDGNPGR